MSPRPEKGIIAHNYQRLINKIKGSATEHYNPEEYRRAFHNPMFSHLVNKTIVKHPSDWYYKSNESVWQSFLKILSEEAPLWRSYSEDFLNNMVWMQEVTCEKLGTEVWHMHPLVFISNFNNQRYIIQYTKYSSTLNASLEKQMKLGDRNPKYGPQIGVKGKFVPVDRSTVLTYLNPLNYTTVENAEFFQYMILTSHIGISEEIIAKALVGKVILAGKEKSFIEASKKFNVNEMYLVAHAIVETGHGKSPLAKGVSHNGKTVHNMYGIAAYDGAAESEGKKFAYLKGWDTPEKAIIGGAIL